MPQIVRDTLPKHRYRMSRRPLHAANRRSLPIPSSIAKHREPISLPRNIHLLQEALMPADPTWWTWGDFLSIGILCVIFYIAKCYRLLRYHCVKIGQLSKGRRHLVRFFETPRKCSRTSWQCVDWTAENNPLVDHNGTVHYLWGCVPW